jgi:hypothetical protein
MKTLDKLQTEVPRVGKTGQRSPILPGCVHKTYAPDTPSYFSDSFLVGNQVNRGSRREVILGQLRLNRTQGLVLGFFILAWASLVTIFLAAPEVYDQALRFPASSDRRLFDLAFLAALSAFLVLLGVGVVRRWRWTFWLIVVAFLAGVLRVPVSILQLSGVLRAEGPAWYVLLQAIIGMVQVAIGLAMLAGYRRSGVWGSF